MFEKRRYSFRFIVLAPLLVTLSVIALIIFNYVTTLDRDIHNEYLRVNAALERSAKLVTALDYSFLNYSGSGYSLLLEHNRRVVDGLCQMWPIDALLLTEGRDYQLPAVDISYMLVGEASLCEKGSPLYKKVSGKVSLAPILSFLHDVDIYLKGLHYIDGNGYVMSSPDTLARSYTVELLRNITARPYWYRTKNNRDKITLTGPYPELFSDDQTLSMTIPVYEKGVHQGIISLDIDVEKLLTSRTELPSDLSIVDGSELSKLRNVHQPMALSSNFIIGDQFIYYHLDWLGEIFSFIKSQKYSLVLVAAIYFVGMFSLIFINSTMERRYFKELAATDPMTGLLNRRGLETFLSHSQPMKYIAIAVFDIDDFKRINDTYGHDVGDDAIRYTADTLISSVRSSDAVARFGGEEFVVYLSGHNKTDLNQTLSRLLTSISAASERVVEGGFTVSGGGQIILSEAFDGFEEHFKAADDKLYQAKNSGKNRLIT